MMTIAQAPGANAIATGDAVLAEFERLSATFPPGLEYTVVYDATRFVRASVEQIVTVLVEAFLIVTIITLLCLQHCRAPAISDIAIPSPLLGAMAVIFASASSPPPPTLFPPGPDR